MLSCVGVIVFFICVIFVSSFGLIPLSVCFKCIHFSLFLVGISFPVGIILMFPTLIMGITPLFSSVGYLSVDTAPPFWLAEKLLCSIAFLLAESLRCENLLVSAISVAFPLVVFSNLGCAFLFFATLLTNVPYGKYLLVSSPFGACPLLAFSFALILLGFSSLFSYCGTCVFQSSSLSSLNAVYLLAPSLFWKFLIVSIFSSLLLALKYSSCVLVVMTILLPSTFMSSFTVVSTAFIAVVVIIAVIVIICIVVEVPSVVVVVIVPVSIVLISAAAVFVVSEFVLGVVLAVIVPVTIVLVVLGSIGSSLVVVSSLLYDDVVVALLYPLHWLYSC